MAAQSGSPRGGSPRLRLFLVAGVRVVGVILALALTSGNRDACNPLPAVLEQMPGILTGAVVLYHLCAGYLSFRAPARGFLALLVLVLDTLMGVGLTYFFGPAYLILGFTLPVLSTAFSYGKS